ncbi:type IV secretion protein Rhs [Escherichia coli]|uniref:DUF4329 domain-containing protein n=1 Tax=Escherichia coli TaxID=562 RepID=UPI0010B71103|nr:DUF4329 domain-containing protein [Escherichia coli]GCG91660.1 type IV secretion protein Rhs [Escherichia coli]
MSGKPAARQGDMTQYGGSIVQGSAGVRIGAPTGVACSVCPGGVTSGHPVNPLLGAKVLPGETDIALPAPLPFILSRTYSSYRTKTPAPVGSLGPGWKMPADIRLQLRDNTLILSDNGGRSLYFEHLFPGEDGYSRSESLWLVRGGVAKLDEGHRLAALWQALNEENPHLLQQLIRLPGQQYDEESGLYYNRHRYYDPLQGRYITQDPIGLKGGWNLYGYQLNPISDIDPLGLSMWEDAKSGACTNGLCGTLSAMIGPDKFDSIDSTAYDALNKINSQSICEDKEFAGLICKDNSGRYFSTAPNRGERKGSYPFNSPCPNGTEKVSAYHTHGADSHGEYWDEIFSGKDEKIVKSKDNNIKSFYLGTPSGNFKAIDNHGKEITNGKGLPNVCRVHGNM